jgi:hypothetical protein
MAEKTFHVYRIESGDWTVRKAGARSAVFPNQQQALKAARLQAKNRSQSQIVIHSADGKLVIKQVHGLPVVQKPPQKSSLGTARISKAISDAVRKRLETA